MRSVIGWVMVAAALVVGGCGGGDKLARRDVVVSLDPALVQGSTPTVEVNIVAVASGDVGKWTGKSMTQYWMPQDPDRTGAEGYLTRMRFGPGMTAPQTLGRGDKVWTMWEARGATELFVLANLPGGHADRPGAEDTRRLVLPLDRERWEDGQAIRVVVERGRLRSETMPKVKKK